MSEVEWPSPRPFPAEPGSARGSIVEVKSRASSERLPSLAPGWAGSCLGYLLVALDTKP